MESPTSDIQDKPTVELHKFIESFSVDVHSGTPRNGFAVYLCNKYNIDDASSALDTIFMQHVNGYTSNERAVLVKLKHLISKVTKYREEFDNFLLEPIKVPMQKLKTRTVSTTDDTSEGVILEEGPPPAKKTLATDVKTKADLDQLIESYSGDENVGILRKGFAVYLLCKKHMYNISDASNALDNIFMKLDNSYSSNKLGVYAILRKINSTMTSWKKNIKRFWPQIEKFLHEPFRVPMKKLTAQPLISAATTTVDMSEGAAQEVEPPPAKQLRRDCEQCLSVREECRAKCRALENKLKEKRRVIRNMSKLYCVKYVNKQRKRLYETIAKLKSKLKDLKKNVANQEAAKTQKRKKVSKLSKPTNGTQTIQSSKPTYEVKTTESYKPSDKVQTIKIKVSKPAVQSLPLPEPTSQMQPITLSKSTDEVQALQLCQPNVQPLKETL